jgi:hypothetical protein
MGGNFMALKRSFLESMGLTEQQISAIMDEHTAVTDRMKKEIEQYKADADRLPEVQKELDAIKGGEDYKAKYDKEHQDFEDYKAQVARDGDAAKVRSAYRRLLSDEKISEKRLDAICKVTDFSAMRLDKDGSLHDADKLREAIKQDWGEFITETSERGTTVETPPAGKSTMTKADILAIKDAGARQKAIAENLSLFGH